MLINKKNPPADVTITYNQITITTAPGGTLDVRDFGVPNEHIEATEKHILRKNPNVFDVEETKDAFKTNREALKRVSELEAENKQLKDDLSQALKAKGGSGKAVEKLNAEIEGLNKENASLKKQVAELKAKVKSLE